MSHSSLMTSKRFLPLFLTQFLGAFNDNLLKNSLVILATFEVLKDSPDAAQLPALAGGLFILPFFLFSATAGQLADKYDRAKLTRIIKLAEIAIMAFAAAGFMLHSIGFLLFVLFCMGMHSTFFGPIKYALLPQHLESGELLSGNAYIEAGTFLAILAGTIAGGVLIPFHSGDWIVSAALIAAAVLGYFTSIKIPAAPAPEPGLALSFNIFRETWRIVGYSRKVRSVFLSILGISWFWLVGATFLQQFAPYAKDVIHADSTVVTLFLTIFSVGIGAGSFLCNKLLRGSIHSTYVPLAALGISVFGIDLYYASQHTVPGNAEALVDYITFASMPGSWRILADLFLLAVSGGIYIVPLYAIMQHDSDPAQRARVIAANNVINALFMVASALLTMLMLGRGFSIPQIFLATSLANLFVAMYICRLLPEALLRSLCRALFGLLYRVEVRGMEHYHEAGERVLIIANHTSLLDAALIAAYMPHKITFAVNTHIAKAWWAKPLLALVDAFPLDPTNPLATKALIEKLKKNGKCMIFPEGRITVTGSLMKVYEGPGMIADKSGAVILPVRIDGAQYSPFSYLRGKVRIRWFPKITLTVLPPHRFHIDDDVKGRRRRQLASATLYDVMSLMMFDSSDYHRTLFSSLLTARHVHGGGHLIAEDIERKPVSYRQFVLRCFVLGRLIARQFKSEKTMGVLLPTSIGTAITFFALQAFGRTPAMINFTAGSAAMIAACRTVGVRTVLTSRRFIEMGKLENAVAELRGAQVNVVCLEDLRGELGLVDKLFGICSLLAPAALHRVTAGKAAPRSPGVILFTSGSEGLPKAVVLSHVNIAANCAQLAARVDFGPQDKVFNCLPMFHSFGLTGGTLLPILSGIKTFYYPSPLHYRIVPELVYDTNSTILFGTDTFLSGYVRFANAYDLHSLRYIFSGAEKLKEETRRAYSEKYGVRIFEGYGATETSPALATNTPMHNRPGTVGRLMPAIEWKLEKVDGIEHGGRLMVKGPNVMLGYMKADAPGVLQPPENGWYDTGDIVEIDAEGYVTIKGRTKRFAKIGGEMVSLTAVESAVAALWPDSQHAIVTLPDAKKGEQIVLLTDKKGAAREALVPYFQKQKISELSLPKKIIVLDAVPLLGTGKIDYVKAKTVAEEKSGDKEKATQ